MSTETSGVTSAPQSEVTSQQASQAPAAENQSQVTVWTPETAKAKALEVFAEHGDKAKDFLLTAVVNAIPLADRAQMAADLIKQRRKVPAVFIKGLDKEGKKLIKIARDDKRRWFRVHGMTTLQHLVNAEGFHVRDITNPKEGRNGAVIGVQLFRKAGATADTVSIEDMPEAEKQKLLRQLLSNRKLAESVGVTDIKAETSAIQQHVPAAS